MDTARMHRELRSGSGWIVGWKGREVRLEKRPRPGGNGEPLKCLNGAVLRSGKGGGWVGRGGAGGWETSWEATEVPEQGHGQWE